MSVSFDPTAYTITEGVDATSELMLERSGDLNREVVVSVSTRPGTAIGIHVYLVHVTNTYLHLHIIVANNLSV